MTELMRSRTCRAVLALPAGVCVLGCVCALAQEKSPASADEDYYPLHKGARWEYKVQAELPIVGRQECPLTVSVKRIVRADGFSYHELESVYGEGITLMQGTWVRYRRIDDNGIHVRFKTLDAAESVYLPLPPKVGRKWTMKGRRSEWSMQIKSVETVEIDGASYDRCLRVEGVRKTKNIGTTEITRFSSTQTCGARRLGPMAATS
jgi:hypothetical protein